MPRFLIILAAICLITLSCKSAGETSTKSPKATKQHHSNKNNDPYPNEEPPKMIGGQRALLRHLHYPQEARQNRVQGTVILNFTVTKKGKATHFKIIKSVGLGCNRAAIRALKKVRFTPGKKDGKPVDVSVTWPVSFRLN